MEQHRQSGAPVNLNALLIGEKTIPKGCRVLHVSSHGMLLHCEPDGRPRTFTDGDSVDIHLTVQHNGEQKKLTIPAHVRHVAENSLDVEFQHPDPVLLDLIESYRISDTHTLEATVDEADADSGSETEIIPMPGLPAHENPSQPAQSGRSDKTGKIGRFIPAMALLCFAGILGAGFFYTNDLATRVATLEDSAMASSSGLKDVQDKLFSASLLDGKYASLDARLKALGSAFKDLDRRVHAMASDAPTSRLVEAPPPGIEPFQSGKILRDPSPTPMKDQPDETNAVTEELLVMAAGLDSDASKTATNESASNPAETAAASSRTLPESVARTSPASKDDALSRPATPPTGRWAINLMSSRDRAYVEAAAARARSMEIPVMLSSATVKGKQYWRLQVTGFSSLAAAKSAATGVEKKLGTQGAWFLKLKTGS
jgi:cell division septation protein DedD